MILALTIACAVVGVHMAIKELVSSLTAHDIDTLYEDTYEVVDSRLPLIRKTWKTHLAKPLFYCVTCMSSVWGTFFYVMLAPQVYFGFSLVVWYLPTIFMVALFGTWIFKLFNGAK